METQKSHLNGCNIVKDGKEDIVYAVGYNHKVKTHKSHLNGCNIVKDGEEDIM